MYDTLKKLRYRKSKVVVGLVMFVLVWSLVGWWRSTDPSIDPTANTYVQVPDSDVKLWSANGRELQWNSTSYDRAATERITYKGMTFNPQLEKERMEKAISELSIEPLLKSVEKSEFSFTLLDNAMVIGYGGRAREPGSFGPGKDLVLIDPKTKTMKKFGQLQVPRQNTTVVQVKDGRVIFFGGETTRKYADNHSDNLTNTVEQLDLSTGNTKVIGRIEMARQEVIAKVLNARDVLILGGWNQREIARDVRWWPDAEIFRVPSEDAADDHATKEGSHSAAP